NAFGIKSVILTEGCADIYNPKTIRASMGAIFKETVYKMDFNTIYDLKQKGIKFIGATKNIDSIDVKKADLTNVIVVLGNEGQGISNELLELCDEMIRIPISSNCESLNAAIAASIIMWEARKE
ncbi:MAG: RNA methyltransferase, partial [Oscillospiraceae bacterium]|nr:RNA methyltransferase [Oscillospiraceae bacterium]